MKLRILVVVFFLSGFCRYTHSQSYDHLEEILLEVSSAQEFLSNSEIRNRYIQVSAQYMGIGESIGFQAYSNKVFDSLLDKGKSHPKLLEAFWRIRDEGEAGRDFEIKAQLQSTGFKFRSQLWQESFLPRLREEIDERIGNLNEENLADHIRDIQEKLEQIKDLRGRAKQDAYIGLKKSSELRAIQAYFSKKFLEIESHKDILRGNEGDLILELLRKLLRPAGFNGQDPGWVDEVAKGFPKNLRTLLNLESSDSFAVVTELEEHFSRARTLRSEFESVPAPQNHHNMAEIQTANWKKQAVLKKFSDENLLFELETVIHPHNKKLVIKNPGGSIYFRAVRRAFHTLLRAFKAGECIKDNSAKWAAGALVGARIYFSEKDTGSMTGYLQLFPAQSRTETYGALEIMTPDTKGDIFLTNPHTHKKEKVLLIDALIDVLTTEIPPAWRGVIISDATGTNNAQGKTPLPNSVNWRFGDRIAESPGSLTINDPLLPIISPENGGYKNTVICDGLISSGSQLRLLNAKQKREELKIEDLKERYLLSLMGLAEVSDLESWALAERGIAVKSLGDEIDSDFERIWGFLFSLTSQMRPIYDPKALFSSLDLIRSRHPELRGDLPTRKWTVNQATA